MDKAVLDVLGEDGLHLNAPPFLTVADAAAGNSGFWRDHGRLDQIDSDTSVILGDFGPGSDAPIIIDLGSDGAPVLALRWPSESLRTHWSQLAPSFDEFVRILGLMPGGPFHWEPYDNMATIGTGGSEGGTIDIDEVFGSSARITAEWGGHAPRSITSGVYGWMVHTRHFAESAPAQETYPEMKRGLADICAHANPKSLIREFVSRFP